MKKINKDLLRIIISIILFTISFFLPNVFKISILLLTYLIISYEVYLDAFKNLQKGEIFDENLLMIIATIGAIAIESYSEAVIVMLLFEIGEYLSDIAVNNSKKEITKLMDLRSDTINLINNNEITKVKTKKAKIGDIFIVLPGEYVPLDGIVVEGESFLDTSSLTGEATPKRVYVNDQILSGSVNRESIIKVKATSTYQTSTATRIMDIINNSNSRKTTTEKFITKFSKIYTPIIVILAILMVLVPTLLGEDFNTYLYRSLIFLVTACPCALVISVPLGYFASIGRAAKEGILIKGSRELESLEKVDYVMLDKTGTITEGVFVVTKVNPVNIEEDKFVNMVASAEANSIHPIAKAIKAYNKDKLKKVTNYKELPGRGLSCTINRQKILIGSRSLLEENNIKIPKVVDNGTTIFVSISNKYSGYIVISDKIKASSYNISNLKDYVKDIIILSGDNIHITKSVAEKVNIENYYSDLLPDDKVDKLTTYQKKGKVMFVGDGINDAPVINISDVGVAMGSLGSDAAIEASDMVIMHDDLSLLKKAFILAKITKKRILEGVYFALGVKLLVLILGIFGMSSIWMAVFADVGVTLIAILNVLLLLIIPIKD